jgi:hypothetical protein
MPTKTLYIDGTNGTMQIGNYGVPSVTNPINYAGVLSFHSNLPYVQIVQKISNINTINFGAVARGLETWADGSKGCGSGGCFITTACVEYMNLADDCYELETLRKFRDEYMLKHENGINLAQTYYETAPKIVEILKTKQNAKEIFTDLYYDYIIPSVKAIEDNNNVLALSIYMNGYNKAKFESEIDNGTSLLSRTEL